MKDAVTIKNDGTVVVDMAKVDAAWNAMEPLARAEMTNVIFEPVMRRAAEMRAALVEAERFMAYFAGETGGAFDGPGTPQECLAAIRAALADAA